MRAAVVTELNGPDGVVIRDVPNPALKRGHVLIAVEYAGISFPDVLQTRGQYQVRPELPFTPGWEISGVVHEDSGSFRAGDRVAAMPFTGGVAESVVVDANYVFALLVTHARPAANLSPRSTRQRMAMAARMNPPIEPPPPSWCR